MPQATNPPMSKPEAYDAYRNGDLSEAEAREFFGDEWEGVRRLERVETILGDQPEPDTDAEDLLR